MSPISDISNASYLESPGIERRIWELQEEAAQDDISFVQQMPMNIELNQNDLGIGDTAFPNGILGMDGCGMASMDAIVDMEIPPNTTMGLNMPMLVPTDMSIDTTMEGIEEGFQASSSVGQVEPPPEPLRLL
jgi:hypothetical protein